MEFGGFFWFLLFVFIVVLIIVIKKIAIVFLIPLIRVFFTPKDLTGAGGHRYIIDMKRQLVEFNLSDLPCFVEAEYDKTVNFKVAGVIKNFKDESKSILSFYGDLIAPKDTIVRQNKLLGNITAISYIHKMELEAESNLIKLRYKNKPVASITSNMKNILDTKGKKIGTIEVFDEDEGDLNLASLEPKYRSIKVHGEEIARTMGFYFGNPAISQKLAGVPLYTDVKEELSDFERQLLLLLVIVDIYKNSVYYFQNK